MTLAQRHKYKKLLIERYQLSLAAATAGYMRYEALRQLNPREYSELCQRNLAGENFDELVDLLILDELKL